ncbi:ABC transporter permease [Sulfitobacter sp. PR48]|jgi:putative spermidine/putrescine transport system permease protein|uniref:ABC transporter permease n=1 Tax=unclassified Sulfitobacter TaxID=196795 RepID=UPI0022AFB8C2|nr:MULTISPECIES: ABC transporter permease [unclassified Sulfitobacter]MCZ4254216.1 ABC transporter permease [Sulfitobacter sp. G21635-S1]MDD9721996.1 ABC transporter permease [Sulfitobacter sp. PR48]
MGLVTPLLSLLRALVYVFLLAPIVVVVLASLNAGNFLTFPPQGLSLRWFWTFLNNDVFIDAIVYSLILAALATAVSLVLGTMAALYFVRHARREAEVVRIGVLLPLILPEILTAIALLFFFYEIGIGTQYKIALFTGHVLMTLPFVFLNVTTSLQGRDDAVELAARTLGASRMTAFRRITLPLIAPGMATGGVFAFIISFDTFGVSFILKGTGSAPLPIQLYDYLRFNFTPEAAAVSTVSILLTLVLVTLSNMLFGRD